MKDRARNGGEFYQNHQDEAFQEEHILKILGPQPRTNTLFQHEEIDNKFDQELSLVLRIICVISTIILMYGPFSFQRATSGLQDQPKRHSSAKENTYGYQNCRQSRREERNMRTMR